VSAAITQDDHRRPGEVTEQRLEELWQQFRKVELELALQKKSATMRGVTCDQSDSETVRLGSAVYVELEFEDCRVRALVDTGSPATYHISGLPTELAS
jgi:hypothetical protein